MTVTDVWLDPVGRGQHDVSINLTSSDWRTSRLSDAAAAAAGGGGDAGDSDGGGLRRCSSGQWQPVHHALYHVAHSIILISFLVPNIRSRRASALTHLALVAGTTTRAPVEANVDNRLRPGARNSRCEYLPVFIVERRLVGIYPGCHVLQSLHRNMHDVL